MSNRYRCLILDHDDTAVNSTASIHYPAHVKFMEKYRPKETIVSLEKWFFKNFNPGFEEFLTKELNFSSEEMALEYSLWKDYTATRIPPFYDTFLPMLKKFRENGGVICVVSHSTPEMVKRDYDHHGNRYGISPDMVFGWNDNPEKRKPSPYPTNKILNTFDLKPEEALVVDDLKPGIVMAERSGVPAAGAGWSHNIPEIREYMNTHCRIFCETIQELENHIFK